MFKRLWAIVKTWLGIGITKVEESFSEIDILKNKVKESKDNLKSMGEKMDEIGGKIITYEEQIQNNETMITDLMTEVKEALSSGKDVPTELIETSHSQVNLLKTENQQLTDRIESLKGILVKVRSQYDKLKFVIDETEADLLQLKMLDDAADEINTYSDIVAGDTDLSSIAEVKTKITEKYNTSILKAERVEDEVEDGNVSSTLNELRTYTDSSTIDSFKEECMKMETK